ncbi:hypothetical protein ACTWP4_18840 [Gracilibacillus sp. D59]|uniref:hypothetical protein n=1 Tax=Gracilibacillus sp. D59 TaxID=3457434 RepID=UPI003FCD4344
MNDITLYYDFIENEKAPMWLIISNIAWKSETLLLSLDSIIHKDDIENFIDDNLSVSVLLSDLIMNSSFYDSFGINMVNVERRLQDNGINKEDIKYLVIRVADIKEVFYMDRPGVS